MAALYEKYGIRPNFMHHYSMSNGTLCGVVSYLPKDVKTHFDAPSKTSIYVGDSLVDTIDGFTIQHVKCFDLHNDIIGGVVFV
jgi:hypothetical protein